MEAEETIIAGWKLGDDSLPASALADAIHGVTRAEALLEAARRKLSVAEREADKAEAAANPVLAEYLRAVIEKDLFAYGLYGFPLNVVSELPAHGSEASVYLLQDTATQYDTEGGTVAGDVRIVVAAPQGSRFDSAAAMTSLERHFDWENENGNAEIHYADASIPGVECTAVALSLRNVRESLPALNETSEATESNVRDFAKSLAKRVIETGERFRVGYVGHGGDASALRSDIQAYGTGKLVNQSRTDDRVTRTIEVEIRAYGPYTINGLAERTQKVLERRVNAFVPYLGRVSDVEVIRCQPVESMNGRGASTTARVSIASKAA
jgi:hypothetical protein